MPSRLLGHGTMHPYTKALKESIFSVDMDFSVPIRSIDSEAPSPLNAPKGCPFCNRCDGVQERCTKEIPPLTQVEPEHEIACWKFV